MNHIGLQKLLSEPQRLSQEAEEVNAELEGLVIDNYRVFVENLTCSQHLQSEEKILEEISRSLDSHIEGLGQSCASFKEKVSQFVHFHNRNRKTLQHHMQLLELLEVPQLVDACTRNGFLDEAIELANFVNGLERRHLLASEVKAGEGSSRAGQGVIQSIVNDVHHSLHSLKQQLLMQLTETNSLPKQIQILATLRKMDSLLIDRQLSLQRFDKTSTPSSASTGNSVLQDESNREKIRMRLTQAAEIKHQMDFLEARSVWLQRNIDEANAILLQEQVKGSQASSSTDFSKLSSSKASLGPYGKAIEMLETRRTSLFSIISQYQALFQDFQQTANNKTTNTEDSSQLSVFSAKLILHTWITRQINHLLKELKELLLQIEDGASVRSVLEQSLFLSSRLGQVGCDFSSLVIPLFQDVLSKRLHKDLNTSFSNFMQMLIHEKINFEVLHRDGEGREQLIPLYIAPDNNTSIIQSSQEASGDVVRLEDIPAPQFLMRYPPLAYILNSFLTTINYLRDCPIITIYEEGLQIITGIFQRIIDDLIKNQDEVRSKGSKYFGEGYMSNLGTRSSVAKGSNMYSTSITPAPVKDPNSINDKMDLLYAQALALDLIPHVLLCYDCIFGKIQAATIQAHYARLSIKASKPDHLISNIHLSKELLGTSMSALLEGLWNKLIQNRLLNNNVLAAESKILVPSVPSSVQLELGTVSQSVPASASKDVNDDKTD